MFAVLRLLRLGLRPVTFDMLGFSFAAKCLAVVTLITPVRETCKRNLRRPARAGGIRLRTAKNWRVWSLFLWPDKTNERGCAAIETPSCWSLPRRRSNLLWDVGSHSAARKSCKS
jgi:hypothetical protein